MRNGKEGHVLDIRVVLRSIGHNVVNIVVVFPPSNRKSADEIRDKNSNKRIYLVVVCDANVSGVVGSEYQLVPHEAERQAT